MLSEGPSQPSAARKKGLPCFVALQLRAPTTAGRPSGLFARRLSPLPAVPFLLAVECRLGRDGVLVQSKLIEKMEDGLWWCTEDRGEQDPLAKAESARTMWGTT